jgi:protein TonB
MLQNSKAEITRTSMDLISEQKQRRKMLVALALLLFALIGVLIKDWDFWFPPAPVADSEPALQVAPQIAAQAQTQTPSVQSPAAGPAKGKGRPRKPATVTSSAPPPPVVTSSRAVLPPLEVEVVAGDQHRTIQPGNTSIKVELQPVPAPPQAGVSEGAGEPSGGTTNAAERVHLSPGTADVVSHPVDPSYPLLAKQIKGQGSVVLQALIAKTGNIQNLRVLSGPAILSEAARQAVRQWRFKPYYQAGQPVETEARITVNFTISTY